MRFVEAASDSIPSHAAWLEQMERAERTEGWLTWCNSASLFVAANREFVAALAFAISAAEPLKPALEIAAGAGVLACALEAEGLNVIATDAESGGGKVRKFDAVTALDRFSPDVVLASFAPMGAGIERAMLSYPSVHSIFYIGPLIHERVGPEALWLDPAWQSESLPEVDRYLISRLDFLTDFTRATHQRRAGTVWLRRRRGYS